MKNVSCWPSMFPHQVLAIDDSDLGDIRVTLVKAGWGENIYPFFDCSTLLYTLNPLKSSNNKEKMFSMKNSVHMFRIAEIEQNKAKMRIHHCNSPKILQPSSHPVRFMLIIIIHKWAVSGLHAPFRALISALLSKHVLFEHKVKNLLTQSRMSSVEIRCQLLFVIVLNPAHHCKYLPPTARYRKYTSHLDWLLCTRQTHRRNSVQPVFIVVMMNVIYFYSNMQPC